MKNSLAKLKKSKDDLIMKFGQLHITGDGDAAAHAKINEIRENKRGEMNEMVRQKEEETTNKSYNQGGLYKAFEKKNLDIWQRKLKEAKYQKLVADQYEEDSMRVDAPPIPDWVESGYQWSLKIKNINKFIGEIEEHNPIAEENIKARDKIAAEIAALDEQELALARKCVGDDCGDSGLTAEAREVLEQEIQKLEKDVLTRADILADNINTAIDALIKVAVDGKLPEEQLKKDMSALDGLMETATKYSTAAHKWMAELAIDMVKVEEEKKAANEAANVAAAKAAAKAKQEALEKYTELQLQIKELKEKMKKKSTTGMERLNITKELAVAGKELAKAAAAGDLLPSTDEANPQAGTDDAAGSPQGGRGGGGRKSRRRRRRRTRKGAKKSKKRRRKRRTKKRKAAKKSRRRRRRRRR